MLLLEVVKHVNNRMYDVTGLSLKSGILLSTPPTVLKEVADLQIAKAGAVLMTAEELQVGSYDMNGGQYEAHFDFQNPEHMLERHGETVGLPTP